MTVLRAGASGVVLLALVGYGPVSATASDRTPAPDAASAVVLAAVATTAASGSDEVDGDGDVGPIRMLLLSAAEQRSVWDATQRLIVACMEERGFSWEIVPYDNYLAVTTSGQVADTIEEAEQRGYTPSEAIIIPHPSDILIEDVPGYGLAINGDPDGDTPGCWEVARDHVMPLDGEYEQLETTLVYVEMDASARAQASPEVAEATERWSACMREQGYDYADLSEPWNEMGSLPNDELNRATRVADLRCQQATSWQEIYRAVQAEFELEWIESNPGVVNEFLELKRRTLENSVGV